MNVAAEDEERDDDTDGDFCQAAVLLAEFPDDGAGPTRLTSLSLR